MYGNASLVQKFISFATWGSLALLVPLVAIGFLSESSIPRSPLYPVKRTIENIVLAFESFDKNAQALYKVSLVDNRFSETKNLFSDNPVLLDTSQIQDFALQIESARDSINTVSDPLERNALRKKLIQQINDYKSELVILQTQQKNTNAIASIPQDNNPPATQQNLPSQSTKSDQNNTVTNLEQLIGQLQQEQSQLQQDQSGGTTISDALPSPTAVPTIRNTPIEIKKLSPTPTIAVLPTVAPTKKPVIPTATPTLQPLIPTPASSQAVTSIASDTFSRPNQVLWGTASDGQVWGSDANTLHFFSIVNNSGQITGVNSVTPDGTTYAGTLGPMVTNAEAVLTGKANNYTNQSQYIGFGIMLRYKDSGNFYRGYITNNYMIISKKVGGALTLIKQVAFSPIVDSLYSIRFQVKGSLLSLKVWQTGTPEPASWNSSVTDNSINGPGYCGIRATMQYQTQIYTFTSFQAMQQ